MTWHVLKDANNRKCGEVRLSVNFGNLERKAIAKTAEVTVVADSFCHFYLLDFASQEWVKNYMKKMRLPLLQRLPKLTHDGLPAYRENKIEQLLETVPDLSLANVRSERGFEAYMSETFSKRGTKGSVMQVSGGAGNAAGGSRGGKRTTMSSSRASMRKVQLGGALGRSSQVSPAMGSGGSG